MKYILNLYFWAFQDNVMLYVLMWIKFEIRVDRSQKFCIGFDLRSLQPWAGYLEQDGEKTAYTKPLNLEF